MYIHLGADKVVRSDTVVGIFDTDNTTVEHITRDYLNRLEQEGKLISITYELPKSFVVCMEHGEQVAYLSQLSAATLKKRIEEQHRCHKKGAYTA